MNNLPILLALPALSTLLVWWAGRKDAARDPSLTTLALALAAAAPLFPLLPKLAVLPWGETAAPETGSAPGLWLGGLWLAGSVFAMLRLVLGLFRLTRWRRNSVLLGRTTVDGRIFAELRLLPGLRSPVAAGIVRPVVYLPESWHRWSEDVRATVLAHELAHLRHRDPLRRLVASLACAVHWCNPLVHWMARRLEAQCEFRSDARVLASGVQATDYARLLCSLADPAERPPFAGPAPSPVAAVAMARRSGLEHRIKRLLSARRRPSSRWMPGLLVGLLLAAALACSLLGPAAPNSSPSSVSPQEVHLRLAADPFPGNR